MPRALILGIGGQDGSYLADLLLEKGYVVHGLARRASVDNLVRIRHLHGRVTLHRGDLADDASIRKVLGNVRPDEVYNEADQDEVGYSFDAPAYSADITGAAVGRLLEAVKELCPQARVFQPLSATVFGEGVCDESTPFSPRSPYACAKAFAYHLCRYYRDRRGVKVSTAFLFNHDSPRRSPGYLLQRIARGVVAIKGGSREPIPVGDLDYEVDVGHARDFVQAIRLINTAEACGDYVVGTGVGRTIMEWLNVALKVCNLRYESWMVKPKGWGAGPDRPLIADITKVRRVFDWFPGFTPELIMNELVCQAEREAHA